MNFNDYVLSLSVKRGCLLELHDEISANGLYSSITISSLFMGYICQTQ